MAKVLGESGRYVTEEAAKQSRRITLRAVGVMAGFGFIEGYVVASLIPFGLLPTWGRASVAFGIVPCAWLLGKHEVKKLGALFKQREAMRRGVQGEAIVGRILADFPDEFCVINDVTTPFGNLDHVVVGPTGVFVLDSKSWRGVVSADGKGELLLNGQTTDKPHVRQFVGRMLGVRDRVRVLAPGLDPFYQGLFVFTAARVDAKWGSTGNVHCVRDDQLHDYIVEKDFGTRLRTGEVERIAQAFLGLAHMDREFGHRERAAAKPLTRP
ncbi:MAG: NERD domain-containing protein [Verrucomicrobia bacterium]|nr:NERD domain-containing protein [Verrucomicrobiota bacterium]